MRLARVATVLSATVLSATGAAALVPSAASAADAPVTGAIVDLPGCTDNTVPAAANSRASAALASPINVFGTEVSSLYVHDRGYIEAEGPGIDYAHFYALLTSYTGRGFSAVTYGSTTWNGRPALCVSMRDYHEVTRTGRSDVQALVVDRSDVKAGDFDVVYNYDRVQVDGVWAYSGYELSAGGYFRYERESAPGSGIMGTLEDTNLETGLIHGSRESSVLGRYVYHFRNGALETATPPDTTVEAPTPARSATTSRTFGYAAVGSPDHLRFECRLDGPGRTASAFATCDDESTTYDDLADGTYTFEVRAVDALGGTDPTPASATFTVDTTGPATVLGDTPVHRSNDSSPTFTWSSADQDVESFRCHLDRAPSPEPSPWYDCESGEEITTLGDGDWRFQVTGVDDLGNEGEPVSYDFSIDTEGPATTFTETPAPRNNDATPLFAWTSGAEDLDSYECALERRPAGEPSPWEACTSGGELTTVADGDWTFRVRAIDDLGNEGEPVWHDFTVNTEKATATITGKPAGLSNDATPSFTYVADPSTDLDHFICVVLSEDEQYEIQERCDAAGFTSEALADGSYVFGVTAVDTAGNRSDAATVGFTVDTTAPETTITDGPAGNVSTSSVTFGFASSETPTTFECRISGPQVTPWEPCAGSSRTFTGLTDGIRWFDVRATDAAGNTDISPASRRLVVNLGQPTITATVSSPTPISAAGWYRDAVTLTYTCAGNGSPLAGACPAPREVPRAHQGRFVFRASIATADGDTASVSTTLFIDKGKPQAAIKGFSGKKVYTSMPKPRCKASDPRSGLESCDVTVTRVKRANGDVYVVVKARATDKAGNVRVVTKKAPLRAA